MLHRVESCLGSFAIEFEEIPMDCHNSFGISNGLFPGIPILYTVSRIAAAPAFGQGWVGQIRKQYPPDRRISFGGSLAPPMRGSRNQRNLFPEQQL